MWGERQKPEFLLITHAGVAPRTEPGADSEQKMPGVGRGIFWGVGAM